VLISFLGQHLAILSLKLCFTVCLGAVALKKFVVFFWDYLLGFSLVVIHESSPCKLFVTRSAGCDATLSEFLDGASQLVHHDFFGAFLL
jgi:hypothetical protein